MRPTSRDKHSLLQISYFKNSLTMKDVCGALAQLGERNTGSVEVSGSIPLGSTNFSFKINGLAVLDD